MFKFDQTEVMQKEFNRQRQISDIFTTDVNKVVVSAKVPCNTGKIIVILKFIKTMKTSLYRCLSRHLKTYLDMVYHNMIKILPTK